MSNTINELLDEDGVKRVIDELCEDIKDFEALDDLHIVWTVNGKMKSRYYGAMFDLISNMELAKAMLIKRIIVDGVEEHRDD